ncbi:hypothetical protein HU200_002268 [Digitaria exilis]|uniref:F-box protein n=1 Tax=Digitaria exilis TaxID=1010633 RepID=A0A835KVW8_9POAL|nr:hypothetical protein HU200_002268 [Digitaria exilis]
MVGQGLNPAPLPGGLITIVAFAGSDRRHVSAGDNKIDRIGSPWNRERSSIVACHFTNITGKGAPLISPSFSFLPFPSGNVTLVDSYNGLLLCRCFESDPYEGDPPFHYAVCNPATKKWVMLPDGSGEARVAYLGFDLAVSSHFHVVEFVSEPEEDCGCGGHGGKNSA